MGDYGKRIRLNCILRPNRGALVVAFDHAIILGPIPGTVDPAKQVRRFVEAKADAILLNLGSIRCFADALAPGEMPGLIARLDWTTGLSETAKTSAEGFQTCLVAHPSDALRSGAGADAVAQVVKVAETIVPDQALAASHQAQMEQYRVLYSSLAPMRHAREIWN